MEHRRPSTTASEVSRHINLDEPDHNINLDNARILEVESRWYERGVKEAIHIRVAKPSLNRDGGRFNLPAVWNNVLRAQVRGPGPRTSRVS